MTDEPRFIAIEEAIFFHQAEISRAGGSDGIRDRGSLDAALAAPMAVFGDSYLMEDLFEMAAAYIESMCARHPFIDGNKRTGTVCALTFLLLNGYEIEETYDEQLADRVLDLVLHRIDRQDLASYFRVQAIKAQ